MAPAQVTALIPLQSEIIPAAIAPAIPPTSKHVDISALRLALKVA